MLQHKIVARFILALFFFSTTLLVQAQSTSSPYSKFGLGEMRGNPLPQFQGMGGISTGVRSFDSYYHINVSNPASYSSIRLTSMDMGIHGNYGSMSRDGVSQTNANFNLSHLAFAIPISSQSAMSFGIMPYSSVGYRFSTTGLIDTLNINNVYSGDGDISKAYFGYGIQFGKHFSIGFNANYLFGKLKNAQEAQYPPASGALNSKIEKIRSIYGLSMDYGLQYNTQIGNQLSMVVGYSGNLTNRMRIQESEVIYRTFGSTTGDAESTPLDSIRYIEGNKKTLSMPITHKIGVSFAKTNKWLIGADVSMGGWSEYREGDYNPGFQNSFGVALGGQIIPDITSTKYLNVIDYKFGLRYNRSNIKIDNQDVNEMGVSIGFGLPLLSNRRSAFYKINLAAEYMQRGSANANLVKENFINFRVGFTLNDRWFQRYKYD